MYKIVLQKTIDLFVTESEIMIGLLVPKSQKILWSRSSCKRNSQGW